MTHGEASLFGGLVIEHKSANSLDEWRPEYSYDAPAGVIAPNQHPCVTGAIPHVWTGLKSVQRPTLTVIPRDIVIRGWGG